MTQIPHLLDFIDHSPTAFHAVESIEKVLKENNFIQLNEADNWSVDAEKNYYVKRADASIIIVKTPENISVNSLNHIVGAHTDSPCLKIKNNPTSSKEGYQILNVEVYGGVILNSWFDKDLLLGGRVFTQNEKGDLQQHLVKFSPKLRIPRLAIHLDRQVNSEGFKINPQTHLLPIMGLGETTDFDALLAEELNTNDKILSWDLYLFDAEKSSLGGMKEEFIFAPRLDNLASVHSSLSALLESKTHAHNFQICAYFHHEEIGSQSQNGAGSNFLKATIKRFYMALNLKESDRLQSISKSFFISADMAHAVHPAYASKHDQNHKPYIGKGPVIKSHANMRYATDALSIAKFIQWCTIAGVEYQNFCSSNDVGCGSTIGPMTAATLGIPTIDIGNPMLSMHSIREMAGVKDHEELIKVFKVFFKS